MVEFKITWQKFWTPLWELGKFWPPLDKKWKNFANPQCRTLPDFFWLNSFLTPLYIFSAIHILKSLLDTISNPISISFSLGRLWHPTQSYHFATCPIKDHNSTPNTLMGSGKTFKTIVWVKIKKLVSKQRGAALSAEGNLSRWILIHTMSKLIDPQQGGFFSRIITVLHKAALTLDLLRDLLATFTLKFSLIAK